MSESTISVIIADDHPMIRLGLQNALGSEPTLQCSGTAADSGQLLELLETQACDVLVSDYAMPGGAYGDGLTMLTLLRERFPALKFVIVTGLDQLALVDALSAAGFTQIVSKGDALRHVTAAIRAALASRDYTSPAIVALRQEHNEPGGTRPLSPRELEVLRLHLQGYKITEIAEQLGRSKQTVSTQKVNALRKLGVTSDAQLFTMASELGISVDPKTP